LKWSDRILEITSYQSSDPIKMKITHKSFRAAHPPAQASHLLAHFRQGSIARRRSAPRSLSSAPPPLPPREDAGSPRSLIGSSATASVSVMAAAVRRSCCARCTRQYISFKSVWIIVNIPSASVSAYSNQASSLRSRSRTARSPGAEVKSRSRQAAARVSLVTGDCRSGS